MDAADVTADTVCDYLVSRGGVVKNVELVKHFRYFLQQDDPERKVEARGLFKDFVNAIASIKLENGDKYLVLKPHIQQQKGISPKPQTHLSTDIDDGGILPRPMVQPHPPANQPHPSSSKHHHHMPEGKPPLAAPHEPHPPSNVQQFPTMSVSPPSNSSINPQSPPSAISAHRTSLPSNKEGSKANHGPITNRLSISTSSLEAAGLQVMPVNRRLKSPVLNSAAARRSGSFNLSSDQAPVRVPGGASGRSSPRGKNRFNIVTGPGMDERRSMFEPGIVVSSGRRTSLTPQQRRKAGQSWQLGRNYGSRDSNLAVVGTEGQNNEADDISSVNTSMSGMEYEGLDPTEHEWINASTDADVDTIHRLLMVDPTLVNRKDFFMGYSAVHWAALHGRVDMITGLLINGAMLNIKSNGGYTPLHLAAQRGHDHVIRTLVRDHGARTDIRENSGKLAIDMVKPTISYESRELLATGLKDYGLRRKPVAEARGSIKGSAGAATMAGKMWSSLGNIADSEDDIDGKKRKGSGKGIMKRFSMRRDRKKAYLSQAYDDSPPPKQMPPRARSEFISSAI